MRVVPLMAVVCLASCNSEPSFDERFEEAEKSIREKAAEIDAELDKRKAGADAKGSSGPEKATEPDDAPGTDRPQR